MPKTLYNVDHQPQVIAHDEPAVLPGESREFTDDELAGLTGLWSDVDPREGLSDERAFKRARDQSRAELDDQARSLGIDPSDLPSKQAVADAIQLALEAQAQSIEDVADAG